MTEPKVRRRDLLQAGGVLGLALTTAGSGSVQAAVRAMSDAGKQPWYKKPYRIVQTNLREPDIREDPRKIARDIREFGGNVIVSNVGGIVAFYPTALEYQYRSRFMGDGDFVKGMIEASRAEGLAYIGRFDLTKSMRKTYDAHPEWFMINRDGSPREYAGTYQACPNGQWAQDYAVQILKEGMGRYPMDGVFFNGAGFSMTDYGNTNRGICVCPNCQRRFREMYGKDLPKTDGPADPNWKDYQEFQERITTELFDRNYAVIKAIQPDVAVLGWNMKNEVARGELQRRVDRPAPEWAYQSGEQSRQIQSTVPGKSFSSTSTAHVDYPWRQVLEDGPYHMTRLAQQLGTGAMLDLYLMGSFDDQDDHRFEAPLRTLFQWHKAHEAHYAGLKPGARVAMYSGARGLSALLGGEGKTATAGWRGVYTALLDRRIPFWMVNADRVADGVTKLSTRDWDVVILPATASLSDAEAAALDGFVHEGGTVIAIGLTGTYAPTGEKRSKMPMQSSPIESYNKPLEDHGWSFDAKTSPIDFGGAHIPADGEYYPADLKPGTTSFLKLAPEQPFGPPELSYAHPETKALAYPGILVREFGKGRSIHIPWRPDVQYYRDGLPDHAAIFAGLIDHYAPPAEVRLEGAGPVELMTMRKPGGGLLVHVVNYAGQRNGLYEEPPLIHGLRLGVRGGGAAASLVVPGALKPIGAPDAKGYRWYALPPVGYFEAITVARS
ncbi:MAG TPA: alpha-amylase family protein [Sphingomonas sp.]|uniref:alpha-amylase family protein n=1 Tax=Sphingomonas sp. TaxID=28214 RepID=UPI002D1D586D|nr:alpha-amylase family protein [Sphingomonas sp.]HMI19585.1 alpha-amylase family protein [Sphingomonas sp.]